MARVENGNKQPAVDGPCKIFPRLEWLLAIGITLLLVILHGMRFQNAGGLWRDEVNTVELSSLPAFSDVWRYIEFDSFPMLWLTMVRLFCAVGLTDDWQFRLLGACIGSAIVGALWFNARALKFRFPLWSLLLLGLSPSIIRWGDTMRAYGMGMFLILMTFGLIWRFAQQATLRNFLLATVSSVLSVQTLYYNAVLLFAICCGAVAVTARRKAWKHSIAILSVGAVAAISLIPYIGPLSHAKAWNALVRMPVTAGWLWFKFSEAINVESVELNMVWAVLFLGAIAIGALSLSRTSPVRLTVDQSNAVFFALVTLIVATGGYFIFLRLLSYYTQPWYYVAFMAIAAVSIDAILSVITLYRARILRTVFLIALLCAVIPSAWRSVNVRQTNIDLIAREMEQRAGEGDLIVLNPWFFGVTFEHYYHGRTPWTTLPEIPFHKFHRYDLIKEKMEFLSQEEAVRPVLDKIAATLKSGNRVWWIGDERSPSSKRKPRLLKPVSPNGNSMDWPYYDAWTYHAGYFRQEHKVAEKPIDLALPQLVNRYENPRVFVMEGFE